ncbi:hypothetical protein M413DRAFT_30305 [Hebeloma cylindrosporum]|uniref:Uncharacterized protein n=1 Tax=Hebeloma cylindrosporum TaxID=76867 RepID=A0A0C3C3M1_HEBCY|nr:hypothetical protein M413DRAFT_30305 [Hebeloma cylindrosporum h7]
MTPRPILRPPPLSYNDPDSPLPFASSSRIPPLESPHVHFPPTPVMTKISITHSPFSYDRAPIQVAPNVCALPERGERKVGGGGGGFGVGVTSMKGEGGYFHPSAYKNESMLLGVSSNSNSPAGSPYTTPPMRRNRTEPSLSLLASSSSSERDGHLYHPYLSSSPQVVAPPLVFDHSSESDSDLCGSPLSVDNEVMMGECGISVHLSGFSMGPSFSTSSSSSSGVSGMQHYGEEVHEVGHPYAGVVGKKSRSHRHHAHSKRDSNEGGILLGHVGGMDISDRTRGGRTTTKRVSNSARDVYPHRAGAGASGFTSSFCDPGLEGCLGGF